jgi:hypothetical protein
MSLTICAWLLIDLLLISFLKYYFGMKVVLLPPITLTYLNTDLSEYVLVSRYIRIKTGNSGRRGYYLYVIAESNSNNT